MLTLASLVSSESLEGLWLWINAIDPQYALLLVFVLLFLAGCGLPLPEDIPLTFTGILLGLPRTQATYGGHYPAIIIIGLICYTAIITGDLVAYFLGYRFGSTLAKYPPFKWAMPGHRIRRLQRWFAKFGNATVFFGRMVAGIRFVTFGMAGMARMPGGTFIMYDSIAALVTVPAWIVLGYMVGTHFQKIVDWMGRVSTTTWIALGVAIVLFIVYRLVRNRQRKKEEAASAS